MKRVRNLKPTTQSQRTSWGQVVLVQVAGEGPVTASVLAVENSQMEPSALDHELVSVGSLSK